jgi:hypothetical protein
VGRRSLSSALAPTGIVGRIGQTVGSLLFLGAGLFFLGLLSLGGMKQFKESKWTSTPCRIISSSYELPKRSHDGYRARITYRYTFNGTEYTGTQVGDGVDESSDFEPIQRALLQYVPGSSATCYVNPAAPAEARLRQTSWTANLVWLFAIIPLTFVGVGSLGIVRAWWPARQKPLSARTPATASAPTWLFLIFFLAGAGFMLIFIKPVYLMFAARSWPKVTATVLNSRVRSSSDSDGTTYAVDVLYQYRYDGKQYLSNRYSLMGGTSSGRSGKAQVVASLPRGSTVSVYVNPASPSYALIDIGFSWVMLFALIPAVFVLVGGGGLYVRIAHRRGSDAGSSAISARPGRVPGGGRYHSTLPGASQPGTAHFSSGRGRRHKALALLGVALFWNGLVSIFVVLGIKEREWFMLAFVSVFVLVGLGLLAAAVHSIIGLFNPSLELDLSNAAPRLGETLTIAWSFNGRFDRIMRLTVALEGREEATYRRGTDTHTDRKTFRRLELVDTTRQVEIARGEVALIVPADTMHSFKAPHNQIGWYLVVHGEIPNWPDVKDEFAVEIRPLALKDREVDRG